MKIVVNKCYGSFSISKECAELMESFGSQTAKTELDGWRKEKEWVDYFLKHGEWPKDAQGTNFLEIDAKYYGEPTFHGYGYRNDDSDGYRRNDPDLIRAVSMLGEKANGRHAELAIVEIPDDVEYTIEEYDGIEWVAEKHRTWS